MITSSAADAPPGDDGSNSERRYYYPDRFYGVCHNNGVPAQDVERYDDVVGCCRDPWVDYKLCIKHAWGKRTLDDIKADSMEKNSSQAQRDLNLPR